MRVRIAVAVVFALLAVTFFIARSREEVPTTPAVLDRSGPSEPAAPDSPPAPPEGAATEEVSADRLPKPIDLAAADRDLDLCGRVIDVEGAPVADARIEALIPAKDLLGFTDRWVPRERRPGGETRSASDGTFLFRLERGELRDLRVTHPGSAETEIISCAAGERVEIVLHPAGRVVISASDLEGEPVSGLHVHLDGRGTSGPRGDRRGETDETGVAEITGLPPGRFGIELRHDRLQCPNLRDIVVGAGVTVEVPVLLRPGLSVSGTVRDRETGLPIAGATVIDGQIFLSGRSTTTDAAGRYSLSGLQFAELRAEAEGYGQSTALVTQEPGGTADFELPRADVAVGVVIDGSGDPLAGISVAALIPGAQTSFRETRRASTGEDGSFRIESLHPEGIHTLVVIEPGFARFHLDFDGSLRRPDGIIDLGRIVLRPGRSIEGMLVDGDGSPIPACRVSIFGHCEDRDRLLPGGGALAIGSDGSSVSRRTDDLGRFRFPDLAVGEYRISAGMSGWPGIREMVRIEESGPEPVFVRLALTLGEELEIRLITTEGDPVPGARLSARAGVGGEASGYSDEMGVVRIGGVPAPFLVRLDLPGGYLPRAPLQFDPRVDDGTIVIEREALITGIVLSPDGRPIPRVYLNIDERVPTSGNGAGRIAQTQRDGTFEVRLAPGAVIDLVCMGVCEEGGLAGPSRQVWAGAQGRIAGLVAPVDGVRLRLDRVESDRSLAVRVTDAAGGPVAGARILPSIAGYEMEIHAGETDAEGNVMLTGLPAIPLWLRCVPPEPPPGSLWHWLPPSSETMTPAGQEWRVELQRGAKLSGVVVDEAGNPVDGAVARANTSTGRHLAMRCSSGGEFEFILTDGETADLSAEVRRRAGGEILQGELRGVAAGPESVRIVVRVE